MKKKSRIIEEMYDVQQWEQWAKKPGGPSCKLLHLLDRKGLSALL